jgi:hypothetical protein
VVRPFPGPCASRSYVHRAAPFLKVCIFYSFHIWKQYQLHGLFLFSFTCTYFYMSLLMPGFQVDQTMCVRSCSKLAGCVNKQTFICYSLYGHASKPWHSAGAAWKGCICSSKKTNCFVPHKIITFSQHLLKLILLLSSLGSSTES